MQKTLNSDELTLIRHPSWIVRITILEELEEVIFEKEKKQNKVQRIQILTCLPPRTGLVTFGGAA